MKPIRVCMLAAGFYPNLGGLERQAHKLGRELVQRGHSVCVLTRQNRGLPAEQTIDGIRVHRLRQWGKGRWLESVSYLAGALVWIIRNRRQIDILHAHQSYSPTTVAAVAGLLTGKRTLSKISATQELGERRELQRLPFGRMRRYLMTRIDRVVGVNPSVFEEFEDWGVRKERFQYIPNGVEIPEHSAYDRDAKAAARSCLNLEGDLFVIYTGRLSSEKGLEHLIQAWAQVVPEFSEARLFLLGSGGGDRDVEKDLKASVADLGLGSSVRFLGHVKNVEDYLVASDVFVLGSVSEGMSNALLEAMAAGLAIVASEIPAHREIIEDGVNACVFPYGNVEILTRKLKGLLADAQLRRTLGMAAREAAQTRFSMTAVTSRYESLYREILCVA
ncbi:MAG: glycosyltransferase family 4 protein [Candidatus Omnitrophica bacterium]|nr:glycosyltransferase family 4 protein [Candidatus Omnitrophota bacterium]